MFYAIKKVVSFVFLILDVINESHQANVIRFLNKDGAIKKTKENKYKFHLNSSFTKTKNANKNKNLYSKLNIIENIWNLWKGSVKKNIFRVKNKEDLLPKLYRNLNF